MVWCRDQAFLADLEVREGEAALEYVQDSPVAGCQGVSRLQGGREGVLGVDGGGAAWDESVRVGGWSWGGG